MLVVSLLERGHRERNSALAVPPSELSDETANQLSRCHRGAAVSDHAGISAQTDHITKREHLPPTDPVDVDPPADLDAQLVGATTVGHPHATSVAGANLQLTEHVGISASHDQSAELRRRAEGAQVRVFYLGFRTFR